LGAIMAGGGATAVWALLIGVLSSSAREYILLSILGSLVPWFGAWALARFGDRGAAVGVAVVAGLVLAVAMGLTLQRWITAGWPL
jgi:hypothetical protein